MCRRVRFCSKIPKSLEGERIITVEGVGGRGGGGLDDIPITCQSVNVCLYVLV